MKLDGQKRANERARRGTGAVLTWCLPIAVLAGLLGCQNEADLAGKPIEVVKHVAWQEELIADGEIKTAESTSLNVPGTGWDRRTLVMMVADGSLVEKGQMIARFESKSAEVKLSQAETDLLRKELSEIGIKANADIGQTMLAADGAKVRADLNLSQRYANADLGVFEKNKVLDILADMGFLKHKQHYLDWKKNQVASISHAEQALIGSQKETVNITISEQKKSLASLELLAPHAGVFRLKENWDGSVPQIGSQLWAGNDFGALPDLEQQVASFSVPEGAAFGLKQGQKMRARLTGTGMEFDLIVDKVSKTSSTKSRESPVKYMEFEAKISQKMVKEFNLKPGQALVGKVTLLNENKAITIPNIALLQEADAYFVQIQDGGKLVKKKIELGQRGPVRSEVKNGLQLGDQVVLVPEKKEVKA
jgi:HlyD family secretion protein